MALSVGINILLMQLINLKIRGKQKETNGGNAEAIVGHGEAIVGPGEAIVGHGEAIVGHGEAIVGHGEAIVGYGAGKWRAWNSNCKARSRQQEGMQQANVSQLWNYSPSFSGTNLNLGGDGEWMKHVEMCYSKPT